MRIIPVLDLKGGQVVRAEGGERARYHPIATPLSSDAAPVSVARGLRTMHPFPAFYIADLDAIEKGAPDEEALESLQRMPDAPELWLDAGFAEEASLVAALARPGLRPVLGSESQDDTALIGRFRDHPGLVLSLDFFADGFRGPEALLSDTALWPPTIIVMTLAQVGSGAGPDFARLRDIKARADGRTVIAAGGVRNEEDLRRLAECGIAGALMATALHGGALTPAQLARLSAL
ncbi:HisA/HisF-related TIM barrel protein [Nitratireductor sp. GCM10026969]|uniref:HisA/HisF-related TIM barrel protein n=1 Tax=Nitratireductor sp. GCM10026969 TaxID=3252645 RepID=UPI00361F01A6